jgi:PadR family transcriptional regulator PadR
MAVANLDLLQGTLDLLILKTPRWGPPHGYAVASRIRTALHPLEKRALVESEWGLSDNNRKAKYYQLTPAGWKQLRTRTVLWTAYAGAVFKVLQTV